MENVYEAVVIIETAAFFLEILAVLIIILGIAFATIRYLYLRTKDRDVHHYRGYRAAIGNSLLLGLEILIAADIVNTVVLDPTWENVGILGLLVLIRTFLSWSLFVDIEERWPWQPRRLDEESMLGE